MQKAVDAREQSKRTILVPSVLTDHIGFRVVTPLRRACQRGYAVVSPAGAGRHKSFHRFLCLRSGQSATVSVRTTACPAVNASLVRSFRTRNDQLEFARGQLNKQLVVVASTTYTEERWNSRALANISGPYACLSVCYIQCLSGVRIIRIEAQYFAQLHNSLLPAAEPA
jgi:hypothetical protein